MKWFKHFSNASDDEELAFLISEFGGDGYMYYWRILETIAGQMKPESEKTSLEYPYEKWAKSCGLSQQKFNKISNFVSTLSILFLEKFEKSLKIDCPNLLKIKDNHFKNLQVTGNKLAPRSRSRSRDIPPIPPDGVKRVADFQEEKKEEAKQEFPPIANTSVENFESRFSPTYEHVIEIWRDERKSAKMASFISPKDKRGAEAITIAIDRNELSVDDFKQAVKNLMSDQESRQKYTLEGMYNNLGNWINKEKEKPKPGERPVNEPTKEVKFIEGKCECGKDSACTPGSNPYFATCRACGKKFKVS